MRKFSQMMILANALVVVVRVASELVTVVVAKAKLVVMVVNALVANCLKYMQLHQVMR